MSWDKKLKQLKIHLEPYGSVNEIEEFLNSGYFKSWENNIDNTINDFQEYIQDIMDWELYVKSLKDGY